MRHAGRTFPNPARASSQRKLRIPVVWYSTFLELKTHVSRLIADKCDYSPRCYPPRQSLEMEPSAGFSGETRHCDSRCPFLVIMADECPFGKHVNVTARFTCKTIPTRRQTFGGYFIASKNTPVTDFIMTESNINNVKIKTTYGDHIENSLLFLP